MSSSLQHKLDRVRRPRVQITYDVETNGAMQKTELPFVVGVMADLSGQPKEALRPVKERKFVNIDRDNFNDVDDEIPLLLMSIYLFRCIESCLCGIGFWTSTCLLSGKRVIYASIYRLGVLSLPNLRES
jgi:hypothetical protein